jgi:hypothetical protein
MLLFRSSRESSRASNYWNQLSKHAGMDAEDAANAEKHRRINNLVCIHRRNAAKGSRRRWLTAHALWFMNAGARGNGSRAPPRAHIV